MKRSKSIQLTLVASVAAALTGCNSRPPRRCVNADNQVVDENFCQDESRPAGFYPYHWYYGGPRSYVPIGAVIHGGTSTPPRGGYSTPPSSPSGTSRGVIGSSGEAASGGHGGGAHGGSAHGGGAGE